MQVETLGVIYAQTVSGIRVVMNTGDHVEINTPDTGCVFRIIGTQGLIEFWAWKSAYWIVNQEYPKGERIKVPQSNRTRHQIHLENLADQIRQGTCDFTVAKSSLMALELCEGAYLSHRHRCCVTFPLDRFQPTQLSNWDPGKPYAGTGGGRDGKNL
jgi:predicted dehydrogenase